MTEHDEAAPLRRVAPGVKDSTLVHGIFKAGAKPDQRANVIIRDNAGNLILLFGQYGS